MVTLISTLFSLFSGSLQPVKAVANNMASRLSFIVLFIVFFVCNLLLELVLVAYAKQEVKFRVTHAKTLAGLYLMAVGVIIHYGLIVERDTERSEQAHAQVVVAVELEAAAQFEVDAHKAYLVLLGHVAEAFLDVWTCGNVEPVVVVLHADGQTKVVAVEEFGMVLDAPTIGRITRVDEAELVIEADEQRPVVVKTELGVGAECTHEVVDAGGRDALGEAAPAASGVGDERNRLPAILCGSEKRHEDR